MSPDYEWVKSVPRSARSRGCRGSVKKQEQTVFAALADAETTHVTHQSEGLSMSKKAAEHHNRAAEHYEHAAKHHREAAKHYTAGHHEKAAHHALVAHGHARHAADRSADAAKGHAEEHGQK
jgi:hypothetical protein